jgi:hypothetical protein
MMLHQLDAVVVVVVQCVFVGLRLTRAAELSCYRTNLAHALSSNERAVGKEAKW